MSLCPFISLIYRLRREASQNEQALERAQIEAVRQVTLLRTREAEVMALRERVERGRLDARQAGRQNVVNNDANREG